MNGQFVIPVDGIKAGTVFGYGLDDGTLKYGSQWQQVHGSFSLSTNGDTILIYYDYDSDDNLVQSRASDTVPIFLSALSFSGEWKESGLDASLYGTDSSALPLELIDKDGVVVALDHQDNYIYAGPTTGTAKELRASIQDPANWSGSNTQRVEVSTNNFSIVLVESTTTDPTLSSTSTMSSSSHGRRSKFYRQSIISVVFRTAFGMIALGLVINVF
jgi:hypothetical protein